MNIKVMNNRKLFASSNKRVLAFPFYLLSKYRTSSQNVKMLCNPFPFCSIHSLTTLVENYP